MTSTPILTFSVDSLSLPLRLSALHHTPLSHLVACCDTANSQKQGWRQTCWREWSPDNRNCGGPVFHAYSHTGSLLNSLVVQRLLPPQEKESFQMLKTEFKKCSIYFVIINKCRVLRKHRQPAIFSVYSTLQHQLHVVIALVLFRWLAVSINQEMALMSCELQYWLMLTSTSVTYM